MSLAGQTIGNYKLVQQIGEGGMGVVYLAEHPVIGRKVAIKLLHPSVAKDAETVARFFNEARAIHLIAHPNIVEILDFGQTTDGQPYFIMEYLTGESLAERIARGPVPPDEAVTIVSQICDALQAAHDKMIVHRDLKPHNVYLLAHGGRQIVKILDFGVAKMSAGWDASQSGGQSVKTRTGSLMGTPLYMSPEQCRGSGKLDHRTDIYSLAVILFEMLSGRPPFMAEGIGELFAKHMLEPAPSLSEFAPRTPAHIVRAVARALSKNLEDRFASMKDFRDALSGHEALAVPSEPGSRQATQKPGAGPPGAGRPSATGGLASEHTTLSSMVSELDGDGAADGLGFPARSRKGPAIGIAALILVIAGGAFFALRGGSRSSRTATGTTPAHQPPGLGATTAPPGAAPDTASAKPPAPSTVKIRFEGEPAGAHVFRKVDGKDEADDLGAVPLDLKVPRSAEPATYLMRAKSHRERAVEVDLSRDQVVHLRLEPQTPAADGDRRPRPSTPRPARPKRAAIPDDADGLAVPKF